MTISAHFGGTVPVILSSAFNPLPATPDKLPMEKPQLQIPFRKRIRNMGRFAQIVQVFARHGYWSVMERLEMRRVLSEQDFKSAAAQSAEDGAEAVPFQQIAGMPARLRKSLEELGPAFVKLGQILAVREDLLPVEFTQELRKLHSNVETLPYAIVKQRLMEELGPEKLAQFAHIEPVPLAAGSIAQVHSAKLVTGEDVVIKVQRPDIAQQIETDLDLMLTFAEMFERYIPEMRFARPRAIVLSISEALMAELDFIREASNMSKIAANFTDPDYNYLHIPEVYWNLTSPRVITLERMSGIAADLRDEMIARGIDVKLLVQRGLHMFLKMVFVDGFFHGDLHPGNILAQEGAEIALLDFGMTVRLSRRTRENLAGMLVALTREDFESMVHHYLEIADPDPTMDVQRFQHDIANTVSPYIGLSLQQSRSGKLLWDLARIAAKHNTPFPQDLIIFVKSMATFEGVGTRLDPEFNLMDLCGEFAGDLLSELYSPKHMQEQALTIARDVAGLMRHAPMLTRRLLNSALEGHLRLNVQSDELARLARSFDRGTSRLSISIVVGALLIGSSILVFASGTTQPVVGMGGFVMAGVLGLYIVLSVLRSGKF